MFDPHGAHLELGGPGDGVSGVVGEQVGALLRKVHGHPDAARSHPWADHDRGVDGATTGLDPNLVTVVSADLSSVAPIELDEIPSLARI